MVFWRKKTEEEKEVKKLTKYYMQVQGLDKKEAEEKAWEWMNTIGKKSKELPKV